MPAVDPLSLQVFANLFASIAEEMGVTLQRTSFSPNIKMRRDFSCAVFDASGNLLAQAAHIPVHLGAMPMAMQAVREKFDLRLGDVVILNDPFAGGTHLPDVSLVSASFAGTGATLGYVMCRAHHSDVGGISPGSMPLSTEIYQEGMIIPPVLLRSDGVTNEPLLELLLRNVRTPEERRGDLEAQLAAQEVGEAALRRLGEAYGLEMLQAHGQALQDHSERMMRSLIQRIPPGRYEFVDYLDNDGVSSDPVEVRVVITRTSDNSDLLIDFSGSAAQRAAPINAVAAVSISATLYVMRCLEAEDVPVNQGSLRPLKIIVPTGTVVGAQPPAAVSAGNVEMSQRIVDVLFGALSQALPNVVPAASQGTMNNLALGGYDTIRNKRYAYYETMGGGMGARPGMAGASGLHDHMSNTLNTPVEVLESEYPIRVRRYLLRPGTGGIGETPGGEGLQRDLEFLDAATATLVSERRRFTPYGLGGAGSGALGENILQEKHKERRLPGKVEIQIAPGDVLSIRTPGGGGIGAPHPLSEDAVIPDIE